MVAVIVRALALGSAMLVHAAHPIHTTLTELRYDSASGFAELSIRVFTDDIAAASASSGGPARYLASRIAVVGKNGRRLPLEPCGERRSGDLSWYCVRARLSGGLEGARLTNALLFERFNDQVNIVQVTHGGRRTTLLFTSGATERTL